MSKKQKRKSGAKKPTSAPPGRQDAAGLLSQSIGHLRLGKIDLGIQAATKALKAANTAALLEAARQVLAEVHFRAALSIEDQPKRLEHLNSALQHQPDAPRLRFYRGVTLWQMGNLASARAELDIVDSLEPDRPGIAYLHQLAQLANGQPWDKHRLSPAEANTLELVQGLIQGQPQAQILPLLQEPLVGRSAQIWESLIELRTVHSTESTVLLNTAIQKSVRRPVYRILEYYLGVAALRQNNPEKARLTWLSVKNGGLSTPWLDGNLTMLLREQAFALAQEGRWGDVAKIADGRPSASHDGTLDELLALAFYHLGYDAAQQGAWFKATQQWRQANILKPSRQLSQNLALAEEALENWSEAAEAWREMARRRPRKTDHPDYLTDAQVSAIWSRAAGCYQRLGMVDEVVTCLKNGLKYVPQDITLRLKLVDVLMDFERDEAAQNELERILEIEPQNVKALICLGTLYDERGDRDTMPIWRRVLAVNPQNVEAKEALADKYLDQAVLKIPTDLLGFIKNRIKHEPIKILEAGLQELPEHPKLLLEMGRYYREAGKLEQATNTLLRAFRAGSSLPEIVGSVLHELLHMKKDETVRELIPQARQISNLLPAFWIDQGQSLLVCELDEAWLITFFDEALALLSLPYVADSKAGLFLQIYQVLYESDKKHLVEQFTQRIIDEVPTSGAIEFLDAHHAYFEKHDAKQALGHIRKAIQAARRVNDKGVLQQAAAIENLLSNPAGFNDLFLNLDIENLLPDIFSRKTRKGR
ncbi:MAG: hypothetical protein EXR62_03050 [Chloroflexi bacterium]|nr:hypothetical protein [Chloroflexota bacterium]